jgi:hypothetical protein
VKRARGGDAYRFVASGCGECRSSSSIDLQLRCKHPPPGTDITTPSKDKTDLQSLPCMDLLKYADSDSEPEPSNVSPEPAVLGKRTRANSTEDAGRETRSNGSSNLDAGKTSKVEDKLIKK